jgi:hypothetical protein
MKPAGCWWLTPVILATQEISVQSQVGKIVLETLSQKHPSQKKVGLVECLKVKALNSNPSTTKKNKKLGGRY